MSLLNGIGTFASSLGAFGTNNALKDEVARTPERTPLLNSTPSVPTPVESTPAEVAGPAKAAPPSSSNVSDVPPEYLPIYEAASKRTGIPIDVLIAQAKQESGFRADAIGSAGEIGLHQIKPSTARDPGFGMAGIDPTTLKDPAVNINFAADYLKARAGQRGDFSNPAAVNMALAAYNGGGDPNYVANVRRHMGAT